MYYGKYQVTNECLFFFDFFLLDLCLCLRFRADFTSSLLLSSEKLPSEILSHMLK